MKMQLPEKNKKGFFEIAVQFQTPLLFLYHLVRKTGAFERKSP